MKWIFFDMDGTIANLYADKNWLDELRNFKPTPYENAKPMINMALLAKLIHKVQANGYKVGIISWRSKVSNEYYDNLVTQAKINWLRQHLPSVTFDAVHIVAYGQAKYQFVPDGTEQAILFDDEEKNRSAWGGTAYAETEIVNILKGLV